jgi:hypothetical protein
MKKPMARLKVGGGFVPSIRHNILEPRNLNPKVFKLEGARFARTPIVG